MALMRKKKSAAKQIGALKKIVKAQRTRRKTPGGLGKQTTAQKALVRKLRKQRMAKRMK